VSGQLKYLIAVPMITQTAELVALTFMRYVIQYGITYCIVTDQGTQFLGDVFKRLCKLLKVHKLNTSAYRPESNGALERAHKTMIEYLRCFCNPRGSNWDQFLPFACFVYNTTPHTMTKFTPYEVLFGRRARIPGQLQRKSVTYNYDDIVCDIKNKLQTCHEIARENLMQTKQHRVAQQAVKINMPHFQVGDKVLLRNENDKKLDPLWKGPYTISEVDKKGSNTTIEIKRNKRIQVHVNRLRKYRSRTQ